jgi:membrane-associated phospholipid phosphatase
MRLRFGLIICWLFVAVFAAGQARDDQSKKQNESSSTGIAASSEAPPTADSSKANGGLLPPGADPENRLFLPFAKHLAQDQKEFWTYPLHFRSSDAKYFLPFAAATSAFIASDSWMVKQVPDSPSQLKRSRDFSNYAVFSLVGVAGASYVLGHIKKDDHASEAGLLAGEAAINSTAVSYAIKGITQRARPLDANGTAGFFQGGASFPSEHTAIAWSVASVLAHEYPGTLPKLFAYGLASGVTISRVTAKQHFPSDVIVGSALGWFLGRQVYRAHHDPELGGAAWGSSADESPHPEQQYSWGNTGSPFVPLDSWIYPAFERLAAAGYIHTQMLGMRPWTRSECARLLDEASDAVPPDDMTNPVIQVYQKLESEFSAERGNSRQTFEAKLDSLYTRVTGISGPPVVDSYNFGSTIYNDYGRPYQEGTNVYSGVSGEAAAGPFAFYVKAEYQHSPSGQALPLQAQQAIATQLGVPFVAQGPFAEINRARIIEAYGGVGYHGFQFTFGKQALWWGPTATGPLIWSTNAESIPMLRISDTHPFKLPSILGWLGPMRTEFFLGQLDGQQYINTANGVIGPTNFSPQPFIHGLKISFKIRPSIELGFSRTVVFSGEGHPFTVRNFWRSLTAFSTNSRNDTIANDAGDRHIGFDASYRVPGLGKYLTLYTDSFCEDDPSPLGDAPNRCAWSPGFYLAKLPGLPKLDFRAEGVDTNTSGWHGATGINYSNFVYPNSYSNNGRIIGSWIGRDSSGFQLSSNYWLSPESKIQIGYRHQGVDPDFMKGGWLDDIALKSDLKLRKELTFSGMLQVEKWNFPLLADRTKSNVAISIGLEYRPNWKLGR